MDVRLKGSIVACLLAVAAFAAAGAEGARSQPAAVPGVTSNSILIGGTVPLTGIAAAYASVGRGAEAYFKHVNAKGGVNGRKITYKYLDDAYNPAQTVQQTRELVQQDQVFAIFNSLGTEHNFAIRPYLNQVKVPHVFPASGATAFNESKYPWTTPGFQPSYTAEGVIYAKYLTKIRPGARVAVLFQNDDYGKNLVAGLKKGLGTKGKIIAQETYELTATDMTPQVTKLKASGAKILFIFATPGFAIRTYIAANKLGWKPLIFLNTVAAATNTVKISIASTSEKMVAGSITLNFLKDPTNPRFKDDKGMRLYRSIFRTYGKGDANDVYNVYAMASAHSLVVALRKAGRNLTRESLMKAITSLNDKSNPFLLPGITVKTTSRDRFPLKQGQLQRWQKGRWVPFGPLLNARG